MAVARTGRSWAPVAAQGAGGHCSRARHGQQGAAGVGAEQSSTAAGWARQGARKHAGASSSSTAAGAAGR